MSNQDELRDEQNDIKVCQGLTDEERREIRKSQRNLRKEIPDLDVEEARKRNNKIHEKVRYIRESVLDAENLDEIAKKATIKVDQMVQVRRCDSFFLTFASFHKFILKLIFSFTYCNFEGTSLRCR